MYGNKVVPKDFPPEGGIDGKKPTPDPSREGNQRDRNAPLTPPCVDRKVSRFFLRLPSSEGPLGVGF